MSITLSRLARWLAIWNIDLSVFFFFFLFPLSVHYTSTFTSLLFSFYIPLTFHIGSLISFLIVTKSTKIVRSYGTWSLFKGINSSFINFAFPILPYYPKWQKGHVASYLSVFRLLRVIRKRWIILPICCQVITLCKVLMTILLKIPCSYGILTWYSRYALFTIPTYFSI